MELNLLSFVSFKKFKLFSHLLNSKINGLLLLFKTKVWLFKIVSLCLLAGEGKAKMKGEKVGPPALKF